MRELLHLADALNEENPGQPELEREDKTVGDLMREAEERAERMKKADRLPLLTK